MSTLNPLQRHLQEKKPDAQEGDQVVARLPIEGLNTDVLMRNLVQAGVIAGHWILDRHEVGICHLRLTAAGARLLRRRR